MKLQSIRKIVNIKTIPNNKKFKNMKENKDKGFLSRIFTNRNPVT